MNITNHPSINLSHINKDVKTKNGIGFCYFNPETELLQEFDTSTSIPILPYEESIRRFYIVRDTYTGSINTLKLTFLIVSEDYEIKSIVAKEDVDISDFKDVPKGNTNLIFLSEHPSGIIGVDVLIQSKVYSLTRVPLVIELEVN